MPSDLKRSRGGGEPPPAFSSRNPPVIRLAAIRNRESNRRAHRGLARFSAIPDCILVTVLGPCPHPGGCYDPVIGGRLHVTKQCIVLGQNGVAGESIQLDLVVLCPPFAGVLWGERHSTVIQKYSAENANLVTSVLENRHGSAVRI
uniref:Uncharacterized protein n=1 Tax=Bursaphelenchus xylophilus TaxID=6326 RepID=A0A1I7RQ75_BURXY